tara:strand:+ start:21290 stop:22081 length:792 start_codon:yes stop_codon:yes gene_type:complete
VHGGTRLRQHVTGHRVALGLPAVNAYTQIRQGQAGRPMDIRYDVMFAGELLDGQDEATVRRNLGRLFKAGDQTLDKLFSGKPQLLKRGCDADVARKYREAIEGAGGKPIIRQVSQDTPSGLTLAPPGSDVLRPEERAVKPSAVPSPPSLDVAEVGARLAAPSAPPPPPPDTSHLTLGEVGDTIPTLEHNTAAAPIPDSGLSLAAPGSDLLEGTSRPAAREVDVSGISLAPPGADVLESQYRKRDTAAAPDTSGISLADPPPAK